MKPVRFGIIGCAGIARKAFLPAIGKTRVAEVTAVASRYIAEAEEFAALCGAVAVDGYAAVVERDDVDAVYVATPIGLHAESCIAAARAGKHVLCEKSLTPTAAETERVVQVCQEAGVALLEGFAYQFHSQQEAVRQIVADGEIGTPVLLQAWFGFPPIRSSHRYDPDLGGGSCLDAGTYTVHVARRFFGREPRTINAVLDSGGEKVDIHGSVLMDFGDGQTAQLAFGFDNMYRNAYSVWGTKGIVTTSRAFSAPPAFVPVLTIEKQGLTVERTVPPCDQFQLELEAFCGAITDAHTIEVWRYDALNQAKALASVRSV